MNKRITDSLPPPTVKYLKDTAQENGLRGE